MKFNGCDNMNIQLSIGQNDEIRTGQPIRSDTVRSRRLSFIGHLYRADPWQDHHRALQACIAGPPDNRRRRIGRPRQSWLRTVEADLQSMNLGHGDRYVVSDTLLKRKRQFPSQRLRRVPG